jgi:hypothetical protein
MDLRDTRPVGYQTHILIGRTSAGKMTVLWEWPPTARGAAKDG